MIAIDGPAGAGKSTVASTLARELGFQYVDSGATYRALALTALRQNVDLEDAEALEDRARRLDLQLPWRTGEMRVILNGEDVTTAIREERVGQAASVVSRYPGVRRELVELQRKLATASAVVMEGRDIGTVVFPSARLKIFLTASLAERTRRRLDETGQTGSASELKREIGERDRRDVQRDASPLVRASDAVEIKTDGLSVKEVVDGIILLLADKNAADAAPKARKLIGTLTLLLRWLLVSLSLIAAALGSAALDLRQHLSKKDPLLTRWMRLYVFTRGLYRAAFVIWGRWRVIGRERVPPTGAFVVAANHVSVMDPPAVGSALERPAYYMAKAELFKAGLFGKIIPLMGAFPVKRGVADRPAMKRTLELLAAGELVIIFPEGTRRLPDKQGEAEHGFGWLVHRARVPVIPVGIEGTYEMLPPRAKFLRRANVRVHIGDPMTFDDLWDSPDTKAAIKEIGRRTMKEIRRLRETAAS